MMRNVCLILLSLLGATPCLAADPYPNKPVRVVAPFAPGGGVDITARVVAAQMSEQLGVPFIVENRLGAGGTIANGAVAKSPPDGYTLMQMDTSTAIVPGLYKSLPFDAVKDFTPITLTTRTPNVLVVHPSVKANTVSELVALSRANPGTLNYGSAGIGSALNLFTELFKLASRADMTHVPFKGGGQALGAVLAGQVQVLIISVPAVLPMIKAGKLRPLAVTTDGKRWASLPDVPSMQEAGVKDMAIYAWFGWGGPAGMPKEIVDKLHSEINKAIRTPSVTENFMKQGNEIVGEGPQAFSHYFREEVRRWDEVIKAAGIKLEQ
jgi:tripartite-type tricarboxylate transporter receptor subunit TctC